MIALVIAHKVGTAKATAFRGIVQHIADRLYVEVDVRRCRSMVRWLNMRFNEPTSLPTSSAGYSLIRLPISAKITAKITEKSRN